MIGSLNEVIMNMEKGVYNNCKDGECSCCGECCSALLPLSDGEIRDIKKYIKKKHIKPIRHGVGAPKVVHMDLTCPFLDTTKKKKCTIYPVRPKICKAFRCDTPPSKIEKDKKLFWSTRKSVYMLDLFK